uniref:Uncharacterized protein n=1 Tax=Anguilla anguilla TaxID=7936 RepID=A0A0E9TR94_ANGAN
MKLPGFHFTFNYCILFEYSCKYSYQDCFMSR